MASNKERTFAFEKELPDEQEEGSFSTPIPDKLIEGNYRGQRLTKGLKGEPVRQLQELLVANNLYVNNKIDGVFRDKTEESVKEFKVKENLSKNGIAEETTYKQLRKLNAKK